MAATLNMPFGPVLLDEAGQYIPFEAVDRILSILITGTKRVRGSQAIGAGAEQLARGEVTLGGYLIAINRSATPAEIITLFNQGGTAIGRVKPGLLYFGMLPTTQTDLTASSAGGGNPILDYWIFDE